MTRYTHHRNPEADERPLFSQLVSDLTRVESLVLSIPQKVLDQHPQCAELGAPLTIGKLMYRSMQTLYADPTALAPLSQPGKPAMPERTMLTSQK